MSNDKYNIEGYNVHLIFYQIGRIICPSILRKIENSSILSRLVKGAFWSFIGNIVSKGCVLTASIFVARILGKSVYGEFGIIQSTIGMFSVFAGFGLGQTATKHVAELKKNDPERAGRIIGLSRLVTFISGGVIALIFFIFAPWIATNTINAPHLIKELRISSLVLFFSAINGSQTGALAGFEAFKTIANVNVIIGLLTFPMLYIGAYLGGITGTVWALLLNVILNCVLNYIALKRNAKCWSIKIRTIGWNRELNVLWKFSMPMLLCSVMVAPTEWICRTFIVNQPNGYAQMGLFNAANQWYTMLLFIPNVFAIALLPIISEQFKKKQLNSILKASTFSIKINTIISIPIIVVTSMFSSLIMQLYGDDFSEGWPVLVVSVFTAGLIVIQTPLSQLVFASGMVWLGFAMNCIWATVYIISSFSFSEYGALGLSIARCISHIIQLISLITFTVYFARVKSFAQLKI